MAQIFDICRCSKICFADVILGTDPNIPIIVNPGLHTVTFPNDFVWNNYSDAQLEELGIHNYLQDNVENIIRFIRATRSIISIYFTFSNPGGYLGGLKGAILDAFPHLYKGSIYTPTVQDLANFQAYPNRAFSIAHHWVWCNIPGHPIPVNNPNFVALNTAWLLQHNVNPGNF